MTREILFWCVAGGMVLFAALCVVLAFVRPRLFCGIEDDSRAAARSILNEELATLKEDFACGRISESLYARGLADVERRALEDMAPAAKSAVAVKGPWTTVGLTASLVIVACALAVYGKIGSPGLINFVAGYQSGGIMNSDGSLADKDAQYDEALLSAYLERNPSDERAQTLYARLLVKAKKWPEAALAYKRALDLNGKVSRDPEVIGEYAASVMSIGTAESYAQSIGILDRALRLDERNYNLHELAAIANLELQRWTPAREHLEVLLSQISMDVPAYRSIAETAAHCARMERLHKEKMELIAKKKAEWEKEKEAGRASSEPLP